MTNPRDDRFYGNLGKSLKSPPGGDIQSSVFQGQGGRYVLPPLDSAFPTSRSPGLFFYVVFIQYAQLHGFHAQFLAAILTSICSHARLKAEAITMHLYIASGQMLRVCVNRNDISYNVVDFIFSFCCCFSNVVVFLVFVCGFFCRFSFIFVSFCVVFPFFVFRYTFYSCFALL